MQSLICGQVSGVPEAWFREFLAPLMSGRMSFWTPVAAAHLIPPPSLITHFSFEKFPTMTTTR